MSQGGTRGGQPLANGSPVRWGRVIAYLRGIRLIDLRPARKIGAPWSVLLLAKALLVIVLFISLYGQFNLAQFRSAFARWPPGSGAAFASRFCTWDSAHYLRLSQAGYEAGSMSCAFYPLWPAAISPAAALLGSRPVLAVVLLANGLSLLAFWMLYRLVERRFGAALSRDALILTLAFPAALFFAFPYSESLYFAIVMVFFWGLELRRWSWVAAAGFLLPLARPVGVFIVLPLAWFLYKETGDRVRRLGIASGSDCKPKPRAVAIKLPVSAGGRKGGSAFGSLASWLLLLCPLLGYAAYFGVMWLWTGNAFEGFEAQKNYPNAPSIKNMFDYAGFSHALMNIGTVDGMMDSMLDRFFFLLFLGLLPFVYRMDKTWFFYVLPAGLVPALSSWFMSYRRYIIVLFPLFVVLAQLLARTRQRWIFWYYVVLLAAMQAWAVWQFVNFNWAG
jgi:hypothetical protein